VKIRLNKGGSDMPRKVTATELRKNIYKLLDEVLSSNTPLEVERKGKRLIITPAGREARIERLQLHDDCIVGDPEELVHMDWSEEWRPGV
jgi:hypothetical protein